MRSERRMLFAGLSCGALLGAEALVVALILLLCLPQPAFAYVDPSVMTYTIQALAGVAVALSAVAGVAFRRVRRRVLKTFNIDENANKAQEGPICRIDPASEDAFVQHEQAKDAARALREKSEANVEKRGLESLTWPRRFAFALLTTAFAFFIILVAPALEIFGANSDSLVFGIDGVWWITVVINAAFALALALALSALRGKAFMAALLFVFSLGLASYLQAFFMNSGMMPADGGYIGWDEWFFVSKMIFTGVIWAAILALPQILSRHHRYAWLRATSVIAAVIIVMQGVGVASVAIEAADGAVASHERPYVTKGSLYDVHPQSNVVYFVLDTYDTHMLKELCDEDPHFLDGFDDFTYYRNSAGVMIPTANAVPYLLSGVAPDHGEDLDDWRKSRYEKGRLVPSIFDKGYTIDIFTDSAMLDYGNPADSEVSRIAGNIHSIDGMPIDVWKTYVAMDQMALYRQAPWVAKPLFWYYTTDVNNRMIENSAEGDGHDELYELDDAGILKTIREQGLKMSDVGEEGPKGSFKFIHLYGPHFPFNIDEDGNYIGVGKSDQMRQAKGSFRVVREYIAELKRLGVYDSSMLIVTADHGVWDEREDPVRHATSPILLVKPRVPKGEGGKPCVVSDMPVSHADLPPAVIEAIGGDPSAFGSGTPVWDIDDPSRLRYFDALTSEGEGGRRFVEYVIDGDVIELDSWSKTGNEWPGA